MVIEITSENNKIASLSAVENVTVNPDDRIEMVKLIDGAAINDGWGGAKKDSGDIITLSATFSPADFNQLKSIWINRKTCEVKLGDNIYNNCHIIVRSYTFVESFEAYKNVNLEIWRV